MEDGRYQTGISQETRDRANFDEAVSKLTDAETRVLKQLNNDPGNKVIAHNLGITVGTVKVHLRAAFRKVGATNRSQAAQFCIRAGMFK